MRTQMLTVALAFVALFVAQSTASEVGFQNVGFFNVSNPAFFLNTPFQLSLAEETSSLLISSFTGNPFEQGAIYLVENVTAYYEDFSAVKPVSLGLTFQWPNAISSLPQAAQEQLGVTNAFIVPDGFLVPGKDNGGLYIVDQKKLSTPYRITPTSAADADNNFFFHSAVWVDIDGDGLLDVLSAHAAKPLFGETKTGLVWYKQPAEGLAALPWAETLITEGPDVFFAAFELDNDNTTLEVVATEFFSKQLSLNVISLGGDKPGSLLYRRVIDTTLGAAYHVDVVGLTSSGTAQLLVTNHESSPSLSGVYAYDIPSDLKKGTFERHTLANGFKVTEGGFNQATPGFAYAIHPEVNATGVPHILVAGDGSQSAYLMTPNAQDYSFDLQTVVDVQGTVGSLLITNDWNEDGLREFLVPDYDSNSVFVYSFTKTNAAGARRRAVQKL